MVPILLILFFLISVSSTLKDPSLNVCFVFMMSSSISPVVVMSALMRLCCASCAMISRIPELPMFDVAVK